jgi:molybdopterin adenylyltransferase
VLTISTSRFRAAKKLRPSPDESGDAAVRELRRLGHRVMYRGLVSDDIHMIKREVDDFLKSEDDVMVTTGGTGASPRDVTIEAVRPMLQKELEGFGELFRAESHKKVGAAAALSRATAGVAQGKLVVCLPGSPDAVELALRVFGGEFPHAVYIARG